MPISRNKLVPGEYYVCQSYDKVDIKIFQYSYVAKGLEYIYGYNCIYMNYKNHIINSKIHSIMTYDHDSVIIPNLRKATQKEISQYYNITYNIKTSLL